MKRNLQRHLNWEKSEGFDWTQWQAIQIKSLRGYREESAKIIDFAFDKASPETEKFITDAFHEGAKSFDLQIDQATQTATTQIPLDQLADARLDIGKDGKVVWTTAAEAPQRPSLVVATLPDPVLDQIPDESFFQVNKAKLDACINDTHRDMDQVRFAAANRMGAGYEEILKKADIFMQTGTMTLQQAIDMASREFLAAGLNCVEYENGRRVNVASYIEMALRASSRRAALTAEGAKRDQWKEYLVVSPTLGSTCPHCQKWQGVVLVDDVYSDGKPDGIHHLLSEAIKDQFLHPNCRHPLVTFFEGITEIPTASPFEQTRTQYEAEKRQRQIELTIRKYKRLRDGSVDPANIDKYSLKVKQWNRIMQQHLKDNPELRRKPEREKVASVKFVAEPQIKDKPIIPITDKAIQQVPLVAVEGDKALSKSIQVANQEILQRSQAAGNVEVAGVFSPDFSQKAYASGKYSQVVLDGDANKLLSAGSPMYLLHNHPRGGRLSLRDVFTFASEPNLQGIGYVSNAGIPAELLTKGSNFDRVYVIREIRRAVNGLSDDTQISKSLYKQLDKLQKEGMVDLWL